MPSLYLIKQQAEVFITVLCKRDTSFLYVCACACACACVCVCVCVTQLKNTKNTLVQITLKALDILNI